MDIFDIIGPVMVGPSSSHTAGAVRIGYISQKLMGEQIKEANILLYGSFLDTGKGHGTNKAIVAGLLGMQPDDMRIPHSMEIAEKKGIKVTFGKSTLKEAHPNSAQIILTGISGKQLEVVGESLGGSRINIAQIDGITTNFSGDYPTLVVHNQDQPGHVSEVTSMLAHKSVNIATMQLYRSNRGGDAVMVLECDQEIPREGIEWLKKVEGITKVTYLSQKGDLIMNYHSINDLVELCHKNNAQIWQVIMMDNAHERMVSEDKIFENMRLMYKAMKTADNNYDKSLKSPSRMAGGDGELMYQYNKSGRNICGDFVGMVMEKALKMGESNACMRRIVAAPTAGSCGVIPAVFISYETYFKALEDDMVKALLIASGIGAVIAENASIAGASGGCQAEIGSASAMAAAGLTFLQGGDSLQIVNSSALALKSMLGLACDPVCGLVEVPCIKRNVAGAMNAITAAQMSMAGIKSVISPDEVIDSMQRIGAAMPSSLKETAREGLAITPTAELIKRELDKVTD